MSLPHALSHSPDPNANPGTLGLNLCEPFRRHSLPVILNLCINLVGSRTIRMAAVLLPEWRWMFVRHSCTRRNIASSISGASLPKSSGIFSSILSPLRFSRPCRYIPSADESPISSSMGGCRR